MLRASSGSDRTDGMDRRGDRWSREVSRRALLRTAGAAGAVSFLSITGAATVPTSTCSVSFTEPTRVNTPPNYGYEPSVHVDTFGTIYVTAHKASLLNEGTRLASYFWYSEDGGSTFTNMPSPGGLDDYFYAFEGDIAIDDHEKVYYCDTYLADNYFARWQATAAGPEFEFEKPMGTVGVDDRPWLRAHGDGIVYYLGNNGTSIPDLEGDSGRIFFYRSTNGGLTFSTGESVPTSYYVSLAESKADDHSVYLGYPRDTGGRTVFVVATSHDRGRTWTRETIGQYETSPSDPFPAWSVTDYAGNDYHVWIDDDTRDTTPGVINFTRPDGTGGYDTRELTPFDGSFTKQWIGAGHDGLVAIVFYATQDVPVQPSSDWFPYALVTPEALADTPTWCLQQLADTPVATDGSEPEDFFEVAVGPDDRIHVTFAHEVYQTGVLEGYTNNILYTQGTV